MGSATASRADPRALATATLAIAAAAAAGAVLAHAPALGAVMIVSVVLIMLVGKSLAAAIALWLGLLFLSGVPSIKLLPHAVGVLIFGAWLVSARARSSPLIRHHGALLLVAVLFLTWLTLSLAWARDPMLGLKDLVVWYVAAVLFLVVATTLTTASRIRLAVGGFIVGAVVAVVLGLIQDDLRVVASALESAEQSGDRLQGGSDDPNFLAAGLVPAIALTAGLRAGVAGRGMRALLLATMVLLLVGLAATESRGGYLAAVVALACSLVLFSGRRRWVLLVTILVALAAFVWAQGSPGAVERIRNTPDDEASGRLYLWNLAIAMTKDHPVVGVGINNYIVRLGDHADEVGATEHGEFIFSEPKVAHSVYLQLVAETGVVGLALYGLLVLGSLYSAALAAHIFRRNGERGMAALAQSVIVGAVGLLTAAAFLTIGWDRRLWFLLALGPALLLLARSGEPEHPPRPALSGP